MATEIELKFTITQHEAMDALRHHWCNEPSQKESLYSIYYDTARHDLRHADMGLRIRRHADHYEMTLKTAGKVIAGLHQRPEYTVPLSTPQLALEHLPLEVWPHGMNIATLTQHLSPLFTTEFTRTRWLMTYHDSQIEVALDQGEIYTATARATINELECELLHGKTSDLLEFAQHICQMDGLRLSDQSKAAIGYALVKQEAGLALPIPIKPRLHLSWPIDRSLSAKEALSLRLAQLLEQWQRFETYSELTDASVSQELLAVLEAFEQLLPLWQSFLTPTFFSALQQALIMVKPVIQTTLTIKHYGDKCEYIQFKLALMRWSIIPEWLIDEEKITE